MKISTKTYYAIRALAYLAKEISPVSVREISEKENLPYEYLEKIFQKLRRVGLVASLRGVNGGYSLIRPAKEITLSDIFSKLEGPFFEFPCFSKSGCERAHLCHTKGVWSTISHTLDEQLRKITLKDIIKNEIRKVKDTN